MIKVRLQSLGDSPVQLPISKGENVDQAVDRLLSAANLTWPAHEVFQVHVNGFFVPKDLWKESTLKESDVVILSPRLHGGGGSGNFLRLAAVIAAVYFLGAGSGGLLNGYVTGNFSVAMVNAGISIAASMAINNIFPPPVEDLGRGDYGNLSSSQMYSITGQANQLRKFGPVPKVYGVHRVFPMVAANPYTEIETDPATKELVQYFYAIYDFGLGPNLIQDIRIGDTPIINYSDVQYNIVDLNRPDTDEGDWDKGVKKNFEIYKSDIDVENVGVAINGNRDAGSPASEYQVIRNAKVNPNGYDQELKLSFVNPQGLIAYNSGGGAVERNIDVEIHFSKVGEENWKPYNDITHVSQFRAVGGDSSFDFKTLTLFGDQPFNVNTPYSETSPAGSWQWYGWTDTIQLYNNGRKRSRGIAAGTTKIHVAKDVHYDTNGNLSYTSPLTRNSMIKIRGEFVGYVASVQTSPLDSAYDELTLDRPTDTNYTLFSWIEGDNGGLPPSSRWVEDWAANMQNIDVVTGSASNPSKLRIHRAESNPCFSSVSFSPREAGEYKVRVVRTQSFSSSDNTVRDDLTWSDITTKLNVPPIVTPKRHTFLEIRIKATNQLNGSLQNLNAISSSALMFYDGTAWSRKLTNNPAWVYVDILTGPVNKRAISLSRLDTDSILEWANYCEEIPPNPIGWTNRFKRFETNFVLDYEITVQELCLQVCGAAQASLNMVDGKYGVLLDKLKTVPVQVFTPRNSRGFNSVKAFSPRPHGLKVKFINPSTDWQVDERIVYDDGYNELNATEFEEMTTFACTNHEQAWRFGRYNLATNRLRRETITLDVDWEYLVCTRGDFVKITQDAMKVGGTPARVKSISGNRITIDDGLEIGAFTYGYCLRSVNGQITTAGCTPVNADTFDLSGTLPAIGDLIVIGELAKVTYDCIVKSITPSSDLTAQLVLVEKADAIYSAESGVPLPDYDAQLNLTANPEFTAPPEVVDLAVTDNFWFCDGGRYNYYIDLLWSPPAGGNYEAFEIFLNIGGAGFNQIGTTRQTLYRHTVNQLRLDHTHEFKVIAISATGKRLDLGSVGSVVATPITKTTRPSDVQNLSSDITNEVLQIFWDQVADCDCREYLIRFSPDVNGTWEASIPLLRVDKNTNLIATQARTGVYLIKAVDWNGNESSVAAATITTIPNLFNLNVIEETNDFPNLLGAKVKTDIVANSLMLDFKVFGTPTTSEYWPEGYYYYDNLLDLGEIYTVRLQSLIRAQGFAPADLMSNWPDLTSLTSLSSAGSSDWDVITEYRTTDQLNVIGQWTTLTSVTSMSQGDETQWTAWKPLIMGDATGRIFTFRLRLVSNKASVTPRIFDGVIRADMPDRPESYQNVAVSTAGAHITYTPAFAGPIPSPSVQITIENGQSGDYPVITSKNLSGFDILIKDKNNNPVARTIDIQVKGYGRKAASII